MNLLQVYLARTLPLIICFIALAIPEPVLACSCVSSPAELKLSRSDFVFTGYLSAEPKSIIGGSTVYTFDQLDILKGSFRSTVDINVTSMSGDACGYNFAPKVKYQVYASKRDGKLWSGLCSVHVVPVGEESIPIEDSMRINKTATDRLLQAECTLSLHGPGLPNCFRQSDDSPLICKGLYISVFSAKDGSYDQQTHLFEWNRRTDELRVTGLQGFLIMPEECENGMDGELRWKNNR